MNRVHRRPWTKTNPDRVRWRIELVDDRGNCTLIGYVIDSWLERAGKTPARVRWRPVTIAGISLAPCATLDAAARSLERA